MEETKDEIIYDIEDSNSPVPTDLIEEPEAKENLEIAKDSGSSEQAEAEHISEVHEPSAAEEELNKMISDIGAETILSIIKDNRNAAIRQIISEVEASRDRSLPSGSSSMPSCRSIFDLAALA